MTDSVTFGRTFVATINTLIKAIEDADLMQDRMASEPTLAAAAAAAMASAGRSDLSEATFTDAGNAIVQIVFTYNSGNPTQKSLLYKML
jgi:hypothetical protein